MCLINFQRKTHSNYKLIVVANRDEFYKRPTAPAHFWKDHPQLLAGRDLLQMGTWLGITKQGRFAALTNFRDPAHMESGKNSRGAIVTDYLTQNVSPGEYLNQLRNNKTDYTGFNVIVGNSGELFHYNNVRNKITKITAGIHGLSNDTLNTPWPKVTKGKKLLREYVLQTEDLQINELFKINSDTTQATEEDLPQTGVGLSLERQLSPLFINTPEYGTRSSTVLLIDKGNNVTFVERTYHRGEFSEEKRFSFQIGNES